MKVTVSDGYDTATCRVYVSGDEEEDLELTPMSRTIDSGDSITFRATGGSGTYRWSTSDSDSDQWGGSTYTVRFYNYSHSTQTRYVTVRSGGESERATIRVRPEEDDDDLRISPTSRTVDHGDSITFRAYGCDGDYRWESSEYGYGGEGSWYQVYFSNYSNRNETQYVTVRCDGQTERATVTVRPYRYPYPTWTPYPYPTWTPNPVVDPYAGLTVSQTARNVTDGQTGHYASVRADGNDTLQFTIRVENDSNETVYNARLTDILPAGLRYVTGSTAIDGESAPDGITSTGINLGTMVPNRVIAVRISAQVEPGYVPSSGSSVVYNTAQVRGDNAGTAASQLPVTLGSGASVTTASSVKTGAGGSVALATLAGLLAALAYARYTRSETFNRRYALARARAIMHDPRRLNFAPHA
jgi:uncharacterized repeat protein (TIGR01451 family)